MKKTKEILLGSTISHHDLEIKMRKVKQLLNDSNEVVVRVKFSGRNKLHLDEFDSKREFIEIYLSETFKRFSYKETPGSYEYRFYPKVVSK